MSAGRNYLISYFTILAYSYEIVVFLAHYHLHFVDYLSQGFKCSKLRNAYFESQLLLILTYVEENQYECKTSKIQTNSQWRN